MNDMLKTDEDLTSYSYRVVVNVVQIFRYRLNQHFIFVTATIGS